MQASVGNIASFTGVLTRRQYKPGQKYVQLLFDTAEGAQLSISQNLQHVKELTVGHTYAIRGQELFLGKKKIIHNPTVTPIKKRNTIFGSRMRVAIVLGMIIAAAGVSAVALAASHKTPPPAPHATVKKPVPIKDTNASTQPVSPPATTQPGSTQPVTTPSPPKTTKKSSPKPAVTAPAAANTPTTPQPVVTTPPQDSTTTPTQPQTPPTDPTNTPPIDNTPPPTDTTPTDPAVDPTTTN